MIKIMIIIRISRQHLIMILNLVLIMTVIIIMIVILYCGLILNSISL